MAELKHNIQLKSSRFPERSTERNRVGEGVYSNTDCTCLTERCTAKGFVRAINTSTSWPNNIKMDVGTRVGCVKCETSSTTAYTTSRQHPHHSRSRAQRRGTCLGGRWQERSLGLRRPRLTVLCVSSGTPTGNVASAMTTMVRFTCSGQDPRTKISARCA